MFEKKALLLGLTAVMCVFTGAVSVYAEEETTQEGYVEEGDGYSSVVSWCENEDAGRNIYGKFYYPADFDEAKTYPTIIMSHGLSVTHEIYEKAGWASLIAQEGYVCYIYDFCGGAPNTLSDLDFSEMSVMTEKSDLNAVIDFVEEKEYCDKANLFLMGQSQGGLVTALEGADRKDEIAGMILIYPALQIPELIQEQYASVEDISDDESVVLFDTELGSQYAKDVIDLDVMDTISSYEKDVLIIHGMNDQTVPYTSSVEALETAYADSASQLVLISGKQSVHAFDVFYQQGQEIARNAALDYVESHLTE